MSIYKELDAILLYIYMSE